MLSQTQSPNEKLFECLEEYSKANGAIKNILYVRGFSELCNPLINKGYEIVPVNGSNYKINRELVITDFSNSNLENKISVKYWILNNPNELKNKIK